MEVVGSVLKRMDVRCGMRDGVFNVEPSTPKAARRITTGLWPGFPSDLVSLVTVLATQAEGRTLVHDWMYELRLFALEQMSGMGANLFLADAHRIIVTGPTKLRGGRVLDLTEDDLRPFRVGRAGETPLIELPIITEPSPPPPIPAPQQVPPVQQAPPPADRPDTATPITPPQPPTPTQPLPPRQQ